MVELTRITHSRKGTFIGRIIEDNDEWAEVEVMDGKAKFISRDNEGRGEIGDVITIRKSLCTFEPVANG